MVADTRHLSESELAAFLDDALPPEDHARVEAHLGECRECRRDVIVVRRALNPPVEIRRRPLMVGAAAAAAMIAFVLLGPWLDREAVTTPILRDAPSAADERVARLVLVTPGPDARVVGQPVRFVWRSTESGARYQITVAAADGATVWRSSLADTTVRLPAEISLRPGEEYFWYVEGVAPDGRSASSPIHPFRVHSR